MVNLPSGKIMVEIEGELVETENILKDIKKILDSKNNFFAIFINSERLNEDFINAEIRVLNRHSDFLNRAYLLEFIEKNKLDLLLGKSLASKK